MISNKQGKMLAIHHLTVRYGPILALKRIHLEVAEGEIVALFGPNGAGKSTLLKSVMGLKNPEEGSIAFEEREIQSWSPEKINRFGIQLIPEDGGIFKTLTVEENLKLGAYHAFQSYQEQLEIVVQLFPLLKERLKQIAGTLSGGEQRVLSFSKSMMFPAKFLMIDEPSLGLSPKFITVILDTLKILHQKGYTILLAEQNIMQFLKCVHRIYLLENGKLIWQGNQQDVKNEEGIVKAYFRI